MVDSLVSAAVFYARLDRWERVLGGESLATGQPWAVERLFFPHCKMEPPWGRDIAFSCGCERDLRTETRRAHRVWLDFPTHAQ